MTKVIYIDMIFLENFLLDFFIFYITAIINNRRLKLLKCTASSVVGALYACLVSFFDTHFFIFSVLGFFVIGFMLVFTFKIRKFYDFLKLFITYISVSFILAGGIFYAMTFLPPKEENTKTETISILLGVILITVMGREFFMLIKNNILKKEQISELILIYDENVIKLKAFSDTGNALVDPLSGCSVVIVSKNRLANTIDIKNVSKIKNLRLIPCRTVSDKYELLYGFKPDKFLYGDNEINAVVAISKEDFSNEGFDAIVNPLTLV